MKCRDAALAVVALLGLAWPCPAADDANQVYESLFGDQARKAAATAGTADDAQFAKALLDSARSVPASPKLQALLCRKAYEFAIRGRDGHATAIDAMKMLPQAAPQAQAEADEKLMEAYELNYRYAARQDKPAAGELYVEQALKAGDAKLAVGQATDALAVYRKASYTASAIRSFRRDEITSRIKEAMALQRLEKEIAEAEAAAAKAPADQAAAMRLLMLHLVDRDDPRKAATLLDRADAGQVLRAYVPLACKPVVQVTGHALLELGAWYQDLASKADPAAKGRMLQRAGTYYKAYLDSRPAQGVDALKARLALDAVSGELRKLGVGGLGVERQQSVLAWGLFSDRSGEYAWTVEALEKKLPTGWKVEQNFSETFDAAFRARLLASKALLVPEPEKWGSDSRAELARAFKPMAAAFLGGGGNVVVCGATGGALDFLRDSGLIDVVQVSSNSSAVVPFTRAGERIAAGVGKSFNTTNATFFYGPGKTHKAEPWAQDTTGAPIVAQHVGGGWVILLGMDFYKRTEQTNQILLNAVLMK